MNKTPFNIYDVLCLKFGKKIINKIHNKLWNVFCCLFRYYSLCIRVFNMFCNKEKYNNAVLWISVFIFYKPNVNIVFLINKFIIFLKYTASENIYWVLKLYEIRNIFKSSVQKCFLFLFMHYLLIKDLLFIRWVWALSYAV